MIGTSLGHYRIVEKIGAGGMDSHFWSRGKTPRWRTKKVERHNTAEREEECRLEAGLEGGFGGFGASRMN